MNKNNNNNNNNNSNNNNNYGIYNVSKNNQSRLNESRSVSSNVKFCKPPLVRFSHSLDKPIIVNQIKNNRRQSIKVNFLNNSVVHRSPHYYRQSINSYSPSIK